MFNSVSRILFPDKNRDGNYLSGSGITTGIKRSTRKLHPAKQKSKQNIFVPIQSGLAPLFDLASGGVCPASGITIGAVGSYPAVSPLPFRLKKGSLFSVALSIPDKSGSGSYPAPCSEKFGLSSPAKAGTIARIELYRYSIISLYEFLIV